MEIREVVSVVETWAIRRHDYQTFTRTAMNEFASVMNANTRKLISMFGIQDPEFYTALAELATNAGTLVTKGARLMVDGRDLTNL